MECDAYHVLSSTNSSHVKTFVEAPHGLMGRSRSSSSNVRFEIKPVDALLDAPPKENKEAKSHN
jgi:hypothetical protein